MSKKRNNGGGAGGFLSTVATILAILALLMVIPLLGSFSGNRPDLPTEPGGPTEPSAVGLTYDDLMDGYTLVAMDDFCDPEKTIVSISTAAQTDSSILREMDAVGNGYIKFCDYTGSSGTYATLKHLQGSQKQIVFEMDLCWNDPGLDIEFLSGAENKMLMWICNGVLCFITTDGEKTAIFDAGEWYKLTYIFDLEARTFSVCVDEVPLYTDVALRSDVTELTRIRMQIHNKSNAGGENGDFQIDNLKWYLPDEVVAANAAASEDPAQ